MEKSGYKLQRSGGKDRRSELRVKQKDGTIQIPSLFFNLDWITEEVDRAGNITVTVIAHKIS